MFTPCGVTPAGAAGYGRATMLHDARCSGCSSPLRYAIVSDGAFRFMEYYARDAQGARRLRPVERCPGCGGDLHAPAQLEARDVAKRTS